MSKSTKPTSTKASKKEQSVNEFREAIRQQTAEKAKERKSASKLIKTPTEKAKIEKVVKEAKEKAPKHTGILNLGTCKVSEAVGLHYRVAKGEQAPKEGDIVLATLGKKGEHQIPLLVRTVQPTVSEETFIQCFLLEKGSGHHEILGAAKLNGETCTVQWR